jgi:inosine triphosphate pyrophosphatase
MTLLFITGNKNKLSEIQKQLPYVEQYDINLPEIQEIDPKEIIKAKLTEALKHKQEELMVEDTSLYLDCLNNLPGPLIKWFIKTIGNKGLYDLTKKYNNDLAYAKTYIGYAKNPTEIHFFHGTIKGKIINPKEETGFGWDPIFQPEGYNKSFAQLTQEEKNKISMRSIALNKLKSFLENNENYNQN